MNLPKVVLLLSAMMFFAVLALDITVPAVVLSIMALSISVVLSTGVSVDHHRVHRHSVGRHGGEAA